MNSLGYRAPPPEYINLVAILGHLTPDSINCEIINYALVDNQPEIYIALSQTWGGS